ncbi:MAG TPA: hydroxymethylbilane synthase [Amycolatopsis sp.]
MSRVIRIGTRGSKLALAQTGTMADALRATGVEVEIVTIKTPGDLSDKPIPQVGVGVFTSSLREALQRKEIDLIVHSLKDLPTTPEPGLVVAAIPLRADPRDALIARDGLTLGELPPGATVGTGSLRRTAQLRALGLGLEIVPIRGNIDTRMRKVTDGVLDAVVLARAGLARIGRDGEITETLDPIQMLPAPAQGALALECRAADVDVEHLLASTLDDEGTRAAVTAERAMMAALEAGCSSPVGALAEIVEDFDAEGAVVERISLRGTAAAEGENGAVDMVRAIALADRSEAEQLGRTLAAELLDLGAGALSGPAQ